MFCSSCGKKIFETDKFCAHCGNKLDKSSIKHKKKSRSSSSDIITEKTSTTLTSKTEISKTYKATGDWSISLSILGLIVSFFLSLSDYTFLDTLIIVIIYLPFLIPFYYYGNKIKSEGAENYDHTLKITRGMSIYCIIFVIINLAYGGAGILWIVLIYYYLKAYSQTKKMLQN